HARRPACWARSPGRPGLPGTTARACGLPLVLRGPWGAAAGPSREDVEHVPVTDGVQPSSAWRSPRVVGLIGGVGRRAAWFGAAGAGGALRDDPDAGEAVWEGFMRGVCAIPAGQG